LIFYKQFHQLQANLIARLHPQASARKGPGLAPSDGQGFFSGACFFEQREPTVHYKIKIKTAAGVQHLDGIFASKWAAIDAGMDVLGEAEGNVVATRVTP
jgi:hypothetical protein